MVFPAKILYFCRFANLFHNEMTNQKVYTTSQALDRAKVYCSKAEHNQKEVLSKLREWGLNLEEAESVLCELISQNYVNEERYALLYSKSKFNQNGWGRIKIKHHLNQMGVSARNIQKGLEEIQEEDYEALCLKLATKKTLSLKGENPLSIRQKTTAYLLSKGFEYEQINLALEKLKVKN